MLLWFNHVVCLEGSNQGKVLGQVKGIASILGVKKNDHIWQGRSNPKFSIWEGVEWINRQHPEKHTFKISHRWEELETLQNVRISRHPTSAWKLEFYAFRIKTLDCKTWKQKWFQNFKNNYKITNGRRDQTWQCVGRRPIATHVCLAICNSSLSLMKHQRKRNSELYDGQMGNPWCG